MKKVIQSIFHAIDGICDAFCKGGNMTIHLCIGGLIILLSYFFFELTPTEGCITFICIGLVISAEMINSAIEEMVDMISLEKRRSSRRIKDMAAGSVLVIAFTSAIIGLIIFVPKIIHLIVPP